jgi:hypothetical protein
VIYRCRTCHYEDARGFLPTASSGLYLVYLGVVSVCCLIVVMRGLWLHLESPNEPVGEVATPWWVWIVLLPISLAITLAVFVLVAAGIHHVLRLVERLAFIRRRCPACGSRKWSRGFTSGFGL